MPLNAVLAYLGLLALVVGGLGLAYEVAVPRQAADNAAPAEITASAPPAMPVNVAEQAQQRSAWPLDPRHAAVPFHETMLELLSPPAPQPAPESQTASAPAESDTTVGVATREAETPRERVIEKRKAKTATPPTEQDATVGVATRGEPDGTRERVIEKKERKAKTTPKAKQADDDGDTVEVEVRDQSGRRIRSERVPREQIERTAREETPRYEERRNDGGERRGFGFPLFNIFGLGGGDRW